MESFDNWSARTRKNLRPEPDRVIMKTNKLIEEQVYALKTTMPADFETFIVYYRSKYGQDAEFEEQMREIARNTIAWRVMYIEKLLWTVAHNRYPLAVHQPFPKLGLWGRIKRWLFGDKFDPQFRLGVGVMIIKDGKLLLGRRVTELGYGRWALAGGGVEFNETLPTAAEREVMEECGLRIQIRPFDNVRDEWFVANHVLTVAGVTRQYIGCFMVADWVSGEPEVKEPDKISEWRWFTYDEMLDLCLPGDPWLPTELFCNYRGRIGL